MFCVKIDKVLETINSAPYWRKRVLVLFYIDENDKIYSYIFVNIISIALKFLITVPLSMPYTQVIIFESSMIFPGKY